MAKALWTQLPGAKVTQPRQRRRVPGMSKNRRREIRLYASMAVEFVHLNPKCKRCGNPSTCVHHWAGRRGNLLKVGTWRASCNRCNLWAKDNPKAAREEGWIAPVGVYKV